MNGGDPGSLHSAEHLAGLEAWRPWLTLLSFLILLSS